MAVIGSAEVLVRPSFKGMGAAARQAGLGAGGAAGKSMTSRMGGALASWGKKIAKAGAITVGAAIGAGLVGGIKSAMSQQASTLVLTGLYNDAEAAKKTMQGLNEVARKSPLGAAAFRKGAEGLAYAGVEGDAVIKTLENVGKTIVGAGGTAEAMDSFTGAMLTGVNRGKFSLNELNQVSNAGVPIFSSLAEHMGISMEEVSAMASAGEIGLDDMMAVLENADTDAFQQSMKAGEEASKSFMNSAKTLWNDVTIVLGDRLQPVLEWVTEKFSELALKVGPALEKWLDSATVKIKDFVQGWQDGEGAGGKFRDVLTNLRDAAQDIWSVFQNRVLPVLKALGGWLTDNPGKIKAVVAVFVGWKLALVGMRVAAVASAVATKAMTAGQWLLNAAMSANPIGLVVAVIAGLVAAFVVAYKKSETFRKIVDAAWAGIKKAAEVAWNFLKDYVFAPLVTAFKALQDAAVAAKDWLVSAWDSIKVGADKVWQFLKTWVFEPILLYYKLLWKIAVKAKDLIVAAWDAVKKGLGAGWNWIKENVFDKFRIGINYVKDQFTKHVKRIRSVWDGIKSAFSTVWNWVKTNVFDRFRTGIGVVKDTVQTQVDRIKSIWDGIKTAFKAPWDWVKKNVFDRFKTGLTNLKGHVTKIKDAMGDAWRTVANKFRSPINWVLDKVWNSGIAKAFNAAAKALNIKTRITTEARIPMFAKGGLAKKGWAIVGEEGPELINFTQPGRVYTADETAQALAKQDPRAGYSDRNVHPEGEPIVPMGGWWDKVKSTAGSIKDGVVNAATGAVNWVKGGIGSAAGFLLKPIRDLINKTTGKWGQVGEFAGGAGLSVADSVMSWASGKDKEYEKELAASGGGPGGAEFTGKSVGGWVRPSRGPVTSEFGMRMSPTMGRYMLHAGIDVAGGGPIFAAKGGSVYRVGYDGGAGHYVDLSHGGGVFTRYFHNPSRAAIPVSPGQQVKAGQRIGQQGATGRVTGTHLHFELHRGGMGRPVNPRSLGLFDQGGLLKPGAMAYHSSRMSKPDAVLTSQQWADVHKLASKGGPGGAGPQYIAQISTQTTSGPEQIADAVLYGMRRLNRGGVHAR